MKIFTINSDLSVICNAQRTRYEFRHLATLMRHGYREIGKAKACYYNRTWERYDFESVLKSLAEKANITPEEKALFIEKIKNGFAEESEEETKSMFNTIANVMAMGEILAGDSQKSKNDWKLRMAKAGIQGLEIPQDWDSLDEATKENRLNKIIQEMRK